MGFQMCQAAKAFISSWSHLIGRHLPWLPGFSITWASTLVQPPVDIRGPLFLFLLRVLGLPVWIYERWWLRRSVGHGCLPATVLHVWSAVTEFSLLETDFKLTRWRLPVWEYICLGQPDLAVKGGWTSLWKWFEGGTYVLLSCFMASVDAFLDHWQLIASRAVVEWFVCLVSTIVSLEYDCFKG